MATNPSLNPKLSLSRKMILSLFDYSGNWSKPYRDAGYTVFQVDLKHGVDILEWDYADWFDNLHGKTVYGILIAVPCTCFAGSGARWWKEMDASGRTDLNVSLVKKSLKIVSYFQPYFWALENPVGRIQKLVPEIGDKRLIFNPCDYGDPYRKRTCLWGKFNLPVKSPVPPLGIRKGQPDEWYSKIGGKSEKTKEYRSVTPMGFARAFFEANQ